MIIHPEVITTPDHPTIKFREKPDQVDLDREIWRVVNSQRWSAGTYFHVQFCNHEKTKVLSSAMFIVSEASEKLITNDDNPYAPMSKTAFHYTAHRVSKWWKAETHWESATDPDGKIEKKVVWNPGSKTHQVKMGDTVLYESEHKKQALLYLEGESPEVGAAPSI
jgi:hypothetical protein